MIAVDTSVWIDYFADRATPQVEYMDARLEDFSESIALIDVTLTEVLQGIRHDRDVRRVEQRLSAFEILRLQSLADFRAAAGLYRAARREGIAIRSATGCLIAAVCIREDLPLLHSDVDFDRLAKITALSTVDVP